MGFLRCMRLPTSVHVGEVQVRGDDPGVVAVQIAARVAALAGADEIFLTDTVAAVVAGSGRRFEPVGQQMLKGFHDAWSVLACPRPRPLADS